MAGRVNTRFVIILVVILTALVGATAAAWYVLGRNDPAKHFAQAQAFEAQAQRLRGEAAQDKAGDDGSAAADDDEGSTTADADASDEALPPFQRRLRDAAREYRNAFKYADLNDVQMKTRALRKLADIYQQYRVQDLDEVRQWLSAVEECWTRLLKFDARDQQARLALLELTHERAELSGGQIQLWNQLYNQADEAVDLVEDKAAVKRYRAVALVNRLESLNVNDDDAFTQAQADLEAAAAAYPDDPEVAYARARLKLIEADRKSGIAEEQEVAAVRDQAAQVMQTFVDNHPDDLEGRLNRYKLLLRRYAIDRDTDWTDKAQQVLNDLEQRCLEADAPDVARQVAQQAMRLDNSVGDDEEGNPVRMGLHRAEKLLRHVVANHPDDVLSLTLLARVIRDQGRFEDAIRFFEIAREPGLLPVETRSLLTGQLRLNALRRLVELHIAVAERKPDDQAQAQLEKARRYVVELRGEAGPRAALTRIAEGQLALAEGDAALAVRRLEEAVAQANQPDAQVLRALASALAQRGQRGAAADRLAQALETREGAQQPQLYLQLASLHLRNGRPDEAMPLIDRILEAVPDNATALSLKARATLLAADNREDLEQARADAIEMLQPHLDEGNRGLTVQYVQLLRQAGRPDEALAILEGYYDDNPDDRGILQMLVGLDLAADRRDQALARIEAASADSPDDPALEALRMTVEEDLTGEERLERAEALLEQEEDPVARHLALYRLYARSGQTDKAQQAMEAVEAADPDNPTLREVRLVEAIQAERWDDAAEIVEWAKARNEGAGADYAGGAFWEGRYLLARGQNERAVATLRRGVEQMPTDSTGRRLLGAALLQTGDLAGAQRQIERAIEIKPDDAEAWLQLHSVQHARGEHAAALESLRMAIRRGGRPSPALLSRFIDYTGEYGDRAVAINAREQLAEQQPDNHDNRRKLVRLYYRQGRIDDADAAMDALLEDAPDDRENVAAKAFLLVSQDKVDQAQELFNEFIHANDTNADKPENWIAYAQALSLGGKYGLADSTFRQAVQRDDSEGLIARRRYADWLMSRGQYKDASAQYGEILADGELGDELVDRVRRRYAEAVMRTGEFDRAQAEIDRLLEDNKDDGQLYLLRAMIARGQLADAELPDDERDQLAETAERAVEQAVRLMPNASPAHIAWAQIHFGADDEETRQLVRDHLETALELNDQQAAGYQLLVRWHQSQGNLEDAVEVQEDYVAAVPDNAEARLALAELYMARGDMTARLAQLLDESEQLMPGRPAWPQMRARMYQAQGRSRDALRQMALAYERDASPGRTIEYLDLMLRVGAFQQALDLLDDRPSLVQESDLVQAMRGRALIGAGQAEAGRNALNAALASAKRDPNAVGSVLAQVIPAVRGEDAAAFLEPHLDDDPTRQIGLALMGVHFQNGRFEKLVELGERLGDLKDDAGLAAESQRNRLLALALAQLERFDQAEAAYKRILEMNDEDVLALNNLAFMLADNMDEAERALPIARKAAELVGSDADPRANVLDTLGRVQYRLGEHRAAAETLRRSIDAKPLVDNHLHLAEVYQAMDRPASARREINAARTLAEQSNDPKVKERVESAARLLDATAAQADEVNP